jgi:hypothetical protein
MSRPPPSLNCSAGSWVQTSIARFPRDLTGVARVPPVAIERVEAEDDAPRPTDAVGDDQSR